MNALRLRSMQANTRTQDNDLIHILHFNSQFFQACFLYACRAVAGDDVDNHGQLAESG